MDNRCWNSVVKGDIIVPTNVVTEDALLLTITYTMKSMLRSQAISKLIVSV